MKHTIRFRRNDSGESGDPVLDRMIAAARAERWTGTAGIKQWARETYGATLRRSVNYYWTSICLPDDESWLRFCRDFGVPELCKPVELDRVCAMVTF